MNKKQWKVLGIAVGVSSLSVMFPPWLYHCESISYSAGYHFFAKPPGIKDLCPSSNPLPGPPPTVLRNESRQAVQVINIIILTAGLLLILRAPRTNLSVVVAAVIIGTGVIGLLYLALMIQFEL